MVKKILEISTWVLSALGLVALLGFARITHYKQAVTGLDLEIQANEEGGFLHYNEIHLSITELVGANITKPLSNIHVLSLQKQLERNPFVAHAEATTTLERRLRVKLIEREPFVRLFTNDNVSYYIDKDKFIFPTQNEHISRVLIANGQIDPLPIPPEAAFKMDQLINKKHPVFSIAKAASAITSDPFMQVLIDQIYVNEKNEIELTPKVGNAPILVGDTTDINQKIFNISAFFQSRANDPRLLEYSSINAKFRNQIVCTKRDTL